MFNHSRLSMVDHQRLASNIATERYHPHHGTSIYGTPLYTDTAAPRAVISIIKRSPTGVGAVFSFAEPDRYGNWHETPGGAAPLVSRPAGVA